jgi:hypothetical protein
MTVCLEPQSMSRGKVENLARAFCIKSSEALSCSPQPGNQRALRRLVPFSLALRINRENRTAHPGVCFMLLSSCVRSRRTFSLAFRLCRSDVDDVRVGAVLQHNSVGRLSPCRTRRRGRLAADMGVVDLLDVRLGDPCCNNMGFPAEIVVGSRKCSGCFPADFQAMENGP